MSSSALTSQAVPATVPEGGGRDRVSTRPLVWILVLGLVVRLALLVWFHYHGNVLHVWDERDYNDIAINLVEHHQFAFTPYAPATWARTTALASSPSGRLLAV